MTRTPNTNRPILYAAARPTHPRPSTFAVSGAGRGRRAALPSTPPSELECSRSGGRRLEEVHRPEFPDDPADVPSRRLRERSAERLRDVARRLAHRGFSVAELEDDVRGVVQMVEPDGLRVVDDPFAVDLETAAKSLLSSVWLLALRHSPWAAVALNILAVRGSASNPWPARPHYGLQAKGPPERPLRNSDVLGLTCRAFPAPPLRDRACSRAGTPSMHPRRGAGIRTPRSSSRSSTVQPGTMSRCRAGKDAHRPSLRLMHVQEPWLAAFAEATAVPTSTTRASGPQQGLALRCTTRATAANPLTTGVHLAPIVQFALAAATTGTTLRLLRRVLALALTYLRVGPSRRGRRQHRGESTPRRQTAAAFFSRACLSSLSCQSLTPPLQMTTRQAVKGRPRGLLPLWVNLCGQAPYIS